MMPALKGRISNPILYRYPSSIQSTLPLLMRLYSFRSIDIDDDGGGGGGGGGGRRQPGKRENPFARSTTEPAGLDNIDKRRTHDDTGRQNPPDPIPNRPLRGTKQSEHLSRGGNHGLRSGGERYTAAAETPNQKSKPGRQSSSTSSELFLFDKFGEDDKDKITKKQYSEYSRDRPSPPFPGEKQGHDFLEKFKLGFDKGDNRLPEAANTPFGKQEAEMKAAVERPPPPPQDADEIFKKMKETGLIPNAVAMLDGLCKDGLVQEAMKLFGLMREKGTIPEVVIYTAVVEGFCKAQKMDDAKRIFRKMQNNGISPNAFSYTILIQGLYKVKRLEDALDFCVEMLEAGHSLNLATFAGLVDGFCREKGLEEARSIIGTLRQKGFSFDEKAVREYLDKKGPFLPLVWEAIFGKKISQRPF